MTSFNNKPLDIRTCAGCLGKKEDDFSRCSQCNKCGKKTECKEGFFKCSNCDLCREKITNCYTSCFYIYCMLCKKIICNVCKGCENHIILQYFRCKNCGAIIKSQTKEKEDHLCNHCSTIEVSLENHEFIDDSGCPMCNKEPVNQTNKNHMCQYHNFIYYIRMKK